MTGKQVASGSQITFVIKGISHDYNPGCCNGRRQPPAVIKLGFLCVSLLRLDKLSASIRRQTLPDLIIIRIRYRYQITIRIIRIVYSVSVRINLLFYPAKGIINSFRSICLFILYVFHYFYNPVQTVICKLLAMLTVHTDSTYPIITVIIIIRYLTLPIYLR